MRERKRERERESETDASENRIRPTEKGLLFFLQRSSLDAVSRACWGIIGHAVPLCSVVRTWCEELRFSVLRLCQGYRSSRPSTIERKDGRGITCIMKNVCS